MPPVSDDPLAPFMAALILVAIVGLGVMFVLFTGGGVAPATLGRWLMVAVPVYGLLWVVLLVARRIQRR